MSKEEKDILFDIDMQLYNEFNDTIALMYDHLGEIYTLRDIEEVEKAEKEKEIKLLRGAIKELQKENKESKELYDKLFNGYNKLVQEHLELEKTIDLIIDDFQMENYFVGMTNKEVREYYKKRKELKE